MNHVMKHLSIMVDMAGCPNRCHHCWLCAHPNGNFTVEELQDIAGQFRAWRDENGAGIEELSVFSWWREPDYRDDYRELWALEQALSSPGCARRFELMSSWRLARDETYAKWAAALPPKACQLTFFGMEENTDWGMRRKGAFHDQLTATERLLEAGIAPRWQLFLTKRCLRELDAFMGLMEKLELHKRCAAIGQPFQMFMGGIAPEGGGYELEPLRLEAADLAAIPRKMIALSRDGVSLLGQPEAVLLERLLEETEPPNLQVNFQALAISANWDVYPNLAEPSPWWRLGNLKRDGIRKIMQAYREGLPPGMLVNRTVPVGALAKRYGVPGSQKLYDRYDLISRFLHQWGAEYWKGDTP